MKRKAIIVGNKGQDGRILYDLLLAEDYELIGIDVGDVRSNVQEWKGKTVDVLNAGDVCGVVSIFRPNEIYYLAAYHHASQEKKDDNITLFNKSMDSNVRGLLHILEAVRTTSPKSKIFYAASSHIFGTPEKKRQDEHTPINPENIYGISKATSVFLCRSYRKKYQLFTAVGILYNHESSFREEKFVSRKIVTSAWQIREKMLDGLVIGDLNAEVDWGYAPDYVRAMRMILNREKGGDYVIATGRKHKVRDFVEIAFRFAGLDFQDYVKSDPSLVAGQDTVLVGNANKLRKETGWRPSLTFRAMVKKLVQDELKCK